MISEKDIEEGFELLNLSSESERKQILSRSFQTKFEEKNNTQIICDNVSSVNNEMEI